MPLMLALAGLPLAGPALASSARLAYEEAYDNVGDGDWYRDYYDDLAPYLNGSESYVMMSLAGMYRATGDPEYLERLAWHADGVLAQRNDARGVTDFTGTESPCWRDMYYTGGRPFCWVLHSGVIIEPMIDFAVLVQQDGLEDELAYDGLRFGEKAAEYVARAEETVAWHDVEWHEMGYYIVRADATFLGSEAGHPYPLNCSNAMGRALIRLYDATGEPAYLEKATLLAEYFHDNLVWMSWGGYAWPYYGDDVLENGEDISHAALNVRFAILAYEHGIVFDDEDMDRLIATLLDGIAIDDRAFHNSLNGSDEFLYDYDSQLYNWLPLSARDPAVFSTVHNVYELSYPAETLTGGSVLEGWALLAEHALPRCAPVLDGEDWEDPDPDSLEDWNTARGPTARLGATPGDQPCVLPVEVDSESELTLTQDGVEIARWQATGGELSRMIPFDPALGATLTLSTAGGILRLRESPPPVPPTIRATTTLETAAGAPLDWGPEASGDATIWWSMSRFPTGARIDHDSGAIDWTPSEAGYFAFVVQATNDAGQDQASLLVCVDVPCPVAVEPEDTGEPAETGAPEDTGEAADTREPEDTGGPADTCVPEAVAPETKAAGCGCGTAGAGGRAWLAGALALAGRSRRRGRWMAFLAGFGCHAEPAPAPPAELPCETGQPVSPETGATDTGVTDTGVTDTGQRETGQSETGATETGVTDTNPTETGTTDTAAVEPLVATAITAGQAHSCALLDDGRVSCWGSDSHDQLDAPDGPFTAIDAGWYHTCGIAEGAAACWGEDAYGQASPPAFPMIAASAAYFHGAGVTMAGDLAVWGASGYPLSTRPSGADFQSLSCGQYHCCALDSAGAATCWGHPPYGITDPPDEAFTSLDAGALHTCGVRADGGVSCWGYGAQGQTTPPEDSFTAVSCGVVHCCGLHEDGSVGCWGDDDAGQASPPDALFVALSAGGYHTCGLSELGKVQCWGNDAQGQASPPVGLEP